MVSDIKTTLPDLGPPPQLDSPEQGLTIARDSRDPSLEAKLLIQASVIDARYFQFEQSIEKSLRAVDLAVSLEDQEMETGARFNAAMSCVILGQIDNARIQAAASSVLRSNFGRHPLGGAVYPQIWLAHIDGDWDTIRRISDDMFASTPQSVEMLTVRLVMHYQLGEFDVGLEYSKRLLDAMEFVGSGSVLLNQMTASALAVSAKVSGNLDNLSLAKKAADVVITSEAATPLHRVGTHVAAGLIAVLEKNTDSVLRHYVEMEPLRGTAQLIGGMGCVDHTLALMAQITGNLDAAATHFEDALTFCRKAGYRPELAWSLCDYADMLLERNEEGDTEKANAHLEESLAISTELGMKPLMERVLSRRDILKA